jgi:hypothetical protein
MNLNLNLNSSQSMALTACMLAISHVDGVHPAETALVQSFYEGGRSESMPPFSQVLSSHVNAESLLRSLAADEAFNDVLITLCLMTGYADGTLTNAERDAILGFAKIVGVSTERFNALWQEVRDSLLGSLASLPDSASVAALAKEF